MTHQTLHLGKCWKLFWAALKTIRLFAHKLGLSCLKFRINFEEIQITGKSTVRDELLGATVTMTSLSPGTSYSSYILPMGKLKSVFLHPNNLGSWQCTKAICAQVLINTLDQYPWSIPWADQYLGWHSINTPSTSWAVKSQLIFDQLIESTFDQLSTHCWSYKTVQLCS